MTPLPDRHSFLDTTLEVSPADLTNDECCICLQPYFTLASSPEDSPDSLYEEPLQLPCGHVFGSQCILRWTLDSNTCPYCRTVLFQETDAKEGVSEGEPLERAFDGDYYGYDVTEVAHREIDMQDIPEHWRWLRPSGSEGQEDVMDMDIDSDYDLRSDATDHIALPAVQEFVVQGFRDRRRHMPFCLDLQPFSRTDAFEEYKLEIEHAIADLDSSGTELVECHRRWMNEYARDMDAVEEVHIF